MCCQVERISLPIALDVLRSQNSARSLNCTGWKSAFTQNMNVNVYDQNAKFIATVNGGAVFVGCNCVGNSVNRVLQIDLDILKLDVSALGPVV